MAFVVAGCLLLAGCSMVRVGYENLPTLAMWQVGKYLSLDAEQKRLVTARLGSVHDWHRSTQLSDYAQLLRSIQRQVATGPIDEARIRQWRVELLERWAPLVDQVAPVAVEVASSIQPTQLNRMRGEFERGNLRVKKEWLPESDAERVKVRARRYADRAEWFLGDLTNAQRRIARETAEQLPPGNEDRWYAQRLARQQDMVATLERIAVERPSKQVAELWVREHLLRYGRSIDGSGPADAGRAVAVADAMMAAMLTEATPAQRRHLDRKLQEWIDTFEQLAAASRRQVAARPN